jgi:hypothetical protein
MKPRALKSPLHARTSLLFERPALTTTETSKGSDARELVDILPALKDGDSYCA